MKAACRLWIIIAMSLITPVLHAQHISITGTITDSTSGKSISGAIIKMNESGKILNSRTDGTFVLDLSKEGNYSVSVSCIGYQSRDITLSVMAAGNPALPITLVPKYFNIEQVIVTATKTERQADDLPARVKVIDSRQIELMPANNVDDILHCDAGLNIDRKSGMFSKNSSVTMRGLNGSYRIMVLHDGIPLNKADGKGINWNAMNTVFIEKIEITKGPLSALYGGNAMGGVINVITRMPVKTVEGIAKVFYGSYNSCGATLSAGGAQIKKGKGIYWGINGFYRRGDGYIAVPDTARDTTDVKMHVWEYTAAAKLGYKFNPYNYVEANYSFYDDKRGDGVRVYDPEGGFFKYTTHNFNLRYSRTGKPTRLDFASYFLQENYFNQKESAKKDVLPPYPITKYTLFHTTTQRTDIGFWVNATRTFFRNHTLTAGADMKVGSVNGSDIYHTSSDTVSNTGSIMNGALFIQDQATFLNNKAEIIAGLRFDLIRFFNGTFKIKSPTSATSFMTGLPGDFDSRLWMALSPKLGITYALKPDVRMYLSYARGFRAPILDDISRNGNINKGIKLANPLLKPEKLDNIEWGMNVLLFNRFRIQPTVYFSIGHDFQYFVGTGDTIDSGNKPKPVLKRENVSTVHILGTELNLEYEILNDLFINLNYAHCHSIIYKYKPDKSQNKDLSGKYLMEVPPNQLYASVLWRNKIVNIMVNFNFSDKVWIDDENTSNDPSFYMLNMKLSRIFINRIMVSFGCQNITGKQFIDSKGYMGIGRYFTGEIAYKL